MRVTIKPRRGVGVIALALLGSVASENPETISSSPPQAPLSEIIDTARASEATELIITDAIVRDEDVARIAELPSLRHIAFDHFEGTAEALELLALLPRLERLQLRSGTIGDAEVKAIAGCKTLKNINLPEASFGDEGLAALASLPALELLRFHSPNVTNDGMKSLSQSTCLRFLHLIAVPITDEGLEHLEGMKQLESLYIDDAEVTDDGIERLLRALPEIHLHINQQHSDRDPSKGTHPH